MKNFYELLENKVSNALNECGYVMDNVVVNESGRRDLAEYQFNGAMSLAKKYGKSPITIAEDIINVLKKDDFFESVDVAGPGFINMFISNKALTDFTNIEIKRYPKNNKLIFLDYGGANVAKSLHVGHLRAANIGEALKRLANYMGYKTIGDTHLGDWGRPLGLVILEISKRYPDLPYFDPSYEGEYPGINITNQDLEEIYPYASNKSKEDEEYLHEAQVMTHRLQSRERGIYDLWKEIMKISKTDIKKIYDLLNAHFDLYNGESDEEVYVPELVDYLVKNNILKESNGAQVIDVKEEDDKVEIPPMLIIKSDGGILYSTAELATIYERVLNYDPDHIWYVVDKRQELHFVQAFRAARKSKIVNDKTDLYFAGFGTMNGSDGKPFKTRDGGVMKLMDLFEMVKEESLRRLNPNILDNRDEIATKIAISAIKFADLLPNRESDYVFDLEKFCDLDGKTGPFILYSTNRMKSLLNKADELGIKYDKLYDVYNQFDRDLILQLNNLDLVLNKAFNSKSLNDITEYLYKLTTTFNRFYTENIILKESDEEKKKSWLYLTSIVYKVNLDLLNILAIEVPERM